MSLDTLLHLLTLYIVLNCFLNCLTFHNCCSALEMNSELKLARLCIISRLAQMPDSVFSSIKRHYGIQLVRIKDNAYKKIKVNAADPQSLRVTVIKSR